MLIPDSAASPPLSNLEGSHLSFAIVKLELSTIPFDIGILCLI